MRHLVASTLVLCLCASVFAVAADARRRATRGERIAIATAVNRVNPRAPGRCFPLSIAVSTVNRNYASAEFRRIVSCRAVVGDGIFVLRRVRPGVWRILSAGTEHSCRQAPRGVIRDLLGTCQ
jgi:hypothetical protein